MTLRPPSAPHPATAIDPFAEVRLLFHRLNNQLSIILSHAELLERKAGDEMSRSRAAQVVAAALEAMSTAKEIHVRTTTTHPV
jgi:two-component sensor histidine kinase